MSSSTSSSEPLRLLIRVLLFCSIPITILGAAYRWGPHASRIDYMGAVAMKHARLDALPSPKVIIIGGSNAAFGIDSERLEKVLCMPVVNMSIHASLGFRFMVEEVKGSIGRGDLVIVALEHSCYSKSTKDNDLHILTADRYLGALHYMPWYQRPKVVVGIAVMRMQGRWKELSGAWKDDSLDPVYRANGFNAQGDVISHLDRPQREASRQQAVDFFEPYIGEEFDPLVRALAVEVNTHGGELVFTWPSIAKSSFRSTFHQAMRDGLRESGFEIIGRTEDYVYPDTLFYDTHYHLNAKGRQVRTTQLIRDLCASAQVHCCVGPGSVP